nr:MAG TPA: hypothetical protein [Caudoviricetes sp.]
MMAGRIYREECTGVLIQIERILGSSFFFV